MENPQSLIMQDPETSLYLEAQGNRIGEIAARSIVDIGRVLLETKEYLEAKATLDPSYRGVFMQWRRDLLPTWSDDKAEYYMGAAREFGNLTHDALKLFHSRAFRVLTTGEINGEANGRAAEYAGNGGVVDGHRAYVYKNGPAPLIEKMDNEDITPKQAAAVTRALDRAPKEVREFAVSHAVVNPEVVLFLAKTWDRAMLKPGKDTSWDDIQHNGGLMIEDTFVSLEEATPRDLDNYNQWRAYGHRVNNSRWNTAVARMPVAAEIDPETGLYTFSIALPHGELDKVDLLGLYVTIEYKD